MRMKDRIKAKTTRQLKRTIAFLTAFIIVAGSSALIKYLIVDKYISGMTFIVQTPLAKPVFFLAMAMVVFLIFELNKRIQNSSVAIGLVIATIMSLPELVNGFYYAIPLPVTICTIAGYFISIPIASYVFDILHT